jgi:hypothetical protein
MTRSLLVLVLALALCAGAGAVFAQCDYPADTDNRLRLLYPDLCPDPPFACAWLLDGCPDATQTMAAWAAPGVSQPTPAELIAASDPLLLDSARATCASTIHARHVAARNRVGSEIAREDCRADPPIPDLTTCAAIDSGLRALATARGVADAALTAAADADDLDAVRACAWEVAP